MNGGKRDTGTSFVLTHPDRVMFPDGGISKRDVADYYLAVMDHLLPEIVGRPVSVVRCPDGGDGPCFYQKHTGGLGSVGSVRLKEKSGKFADYLVVENAGDVMELVQANTIEFHPWGAKARTPEVADRLVFDLDPGPGVAWNEVRKAATRIRDLLARSSLRAFLRTTGGKGLHVVAPLNPGAGWGPVKRFARALADALADSEPEKYTAAAARKSREGKIFIDYLRNTRGATSIASYSLRARPGAPAAVPLAWSALGRLQRANAYDIRSLPARLKRIGRDPWAQIATLRQRLPSGDHAAGS